MTGYEALRLGAAWIDVSDRGKIRATGEDRVRLLHAMSTNHIQELKEWAGLYTFFLNDKGRILTDANIYRLETSLFLDTEPETTRTLFEHLDRYIIADDVTLQDETAAWAAIDLEGPRVVEITRELGYSLPVGETGAAMTLSGFLAFASTTGGRGLRFFVPPAEKAALIASFEGQGALAASADDVRVVRLENGFPRFGEDISERYLVQETQVGRAVHSNKGCYLGQEIVERVRSRGQVHRLLTPIRLEGRVPPAPGTKLSVDGKDIGEITSAVYSPQREEVVGLAYLRSEVVEHRNTMSLGGSGELPVSVYVR